MAVYVSFIFLLIKEVTLEFMTLQYYDPKPWTKLTFLFFLEKRNFSIFLVHFR